MSSASQEDRDRWMNKLAKACEKDKYVSVGWGNDISLRSHVDFGIPTRQPQLDLLMGKDGIPIGRVVEFYGFEASGKTTAALHLAAQVQKMGGTVFWIDTEHTWDPDRAFECGIPDPDAVIMSGAETIDGVFRQIKQITDLVEEEKISPAILIVDSITAVTAEFTAKETDIGDMARPGEEARSIKSGLKRVTPRIAKACMPAVFINHLIHTIGGMSFGPKSQSAGGNALKYMSSVRVKFTKVGDLSEGKKADNIRLGHKVIVTLEKLKSATQHAYTFDTLLLNEGGFDSKGQLLEAMIEIGLIEHPKSSTKYIFLGPEGEEIEGFTKKDWPAIIEREGGFDKMYRRFLKAAEERNKILPWGNRRYA